ISPVASVRSNASRSACATISTMPDMASWATTVTSPPPFSKSSRSRSSGVASWRVWYWRTSHSIGWVVTTLVRLGVQQLDAEFSGFSDYADETSELHNPLIYSYGLRG